MTLQEYIQRHIDWSQSKFGSGRRTVGLCKHIRKELDEIAEKPHDVMEWIDVAILAIDGAWRAMQANRIDDGMKPTSSVWLGLHIENNFKNKQAINISREWPKTSNEDEPTEHVRGNE